MHDLKFFLWQMTKFINDKICYCLADAGLTEWRGAKRALNNRSACLQDALPKQTIQIKINLFCIVILLLLNTENKIFNIYDHAEELVHLFAVH